MHYYQIISRTVLLLLFIWPAHGKDRVFKTTEHTVTVEKIISGLNHPWSVAFLPNNTFLITERSGRLIIVSHDGAGQEVKGLPLIWATGQGGLLDVLDQDNQVYVSY